MSRTLPLAGLSLVLLIAAGQALHDGSELRIGGVGYTRIYEFVALQTLAGGVYLFAVARMLRWPSEAPLWLVLGVAAAMRLIPLCSPMFLSSDLFRYVWDGRVQLAGVNPYRYLPADPALAALRDAAIYPHINRAATARTIYPPLAELVFAAIAWIGQTPRAMRAAMVAFELAGAGCLAVLLRRLGLPSGRLLIVLWAPLPVWEFAGNGHLDAMVVALSAATLLVAGTSRSRPNLVMAGLDPAIHALDAASGAASVVRHAATPEERHGVDGWVKPGHDGFFAYRQSLLGILLAAAFLVKFLPVAVAPAFWRRGDWRLPLAGGLTVLALYACYIGAGRDVLGFLPGYAAEEGVGDGSGVWLLLGLSLLTPLPHWVGAGFVLGVACVLAAAAWSWSRDEPDPLRTATRAGALATFTLVALSPHYPWYFTWVGVFAAISPQRCAVYLGAAALLLYIDPPGARFAWRALVFAPTIALAALDWKRPLGMEGVRRWTSP